MKKLVMMVAAAGMLVAGMAASPGTAAADTAAGARAPGYSPPRIARGECVSTSLQEAGAQCGLLIVPLDYAKPQGTKIAVSRIMHKTSDANAQGVMLVNPVARAAPGWSSRGWVSSCPAMAVIPTTGSASTLAASAPASPR
jgi:hypothetical protein